MKQGLFCAFSAIRLLDLGAEERLIVLTRTERKEGWFMSGFKAWTECIFN
jgi:hypothetical protein